MTSDIRLLAAVMLSHVGLLLSCVVGAQETAPQQDGRAEVWRSLQKDPIELAVSMKNAQRENIIYESQPVLLSVGLRNLFAQETVGLTEVEKQALEAVGIDFGTMSIRVGEEAAPWTNFLRICLGHDKHAPLWQGSLSVDQNRLLRTHAVGLNPLSAMEYVEIKIDLPPGRYQLWAEFDNTGHTGHGEPPVIPLQKISSPITIEVKRPTDSREKAWLLAEKAKRAKRARQYETAEALYRQAIEMKPSLRRGPKMGDHRIFDLYWELADVYEETGRRNEALSAVKKCRDHIDCLPSGYRSSVENHINRRVASLGQGAKPITKTED